MTDRVVGRIEFCPDRLGNYISIDGLVSEEELIARERRFRIISGKYMRLKEASMDAFEALKKKHTHSFREKCPNCKIMEQLLKALEE